MGSFTGNRQWGSHSDPRRLAVAHDARVNSLRPVGSAFNALYAQMPEDVRRRLLTDRAIKRTHNQFSQVVDRFILEHTNSVYLTRSRGGETYDLVVYLDNSLCAAELNARRELIRLKYRELFNIVIDVFEIRISRGPYKNNHPFKEQVEKSIDEAPPPHDLSPEEFDSIEEELKLLEEGPLKESFRRAMREQKRNS